MLAGYVRNANARAATTSNVFGSLKRPPISRLQFSLMKRIDPRGFTVNSAVSSDSPLGHSSVEVVVNQGAKSSPGTPYREALLVASVKYIYR